MSIGLSDVYYSNRSLDTEPVGKAIVLIGPATRGPVMHPIKLEDDEVAAVFGADSFLYREWYTARLNAADDIYLIRTNGCHPTLSFGTRLVLVGTESRREDTSLAVKIVESSGIKKLYIRGYTANQALSYVLEGSMDQLVERINTDATGIASGFMVKSWEPGNASDLGEVGDAASLDLGLRDGTEMLPNTVECVHMLEPYPVAQIGIFGVNAGASVDGEQTLYHVVAQAANTKQEIGIPALYTLCLSENHPVLGSAAEELMAKVQNSVSPWVCVVAGQYLSAIDTKRAICGVGVHVGIVSRKAHGGGITGSTAIGVTNALGTENLSADESLSQMGFSRYRFRNDLYGRQQLLRLAGSGTLVRSTAPMGSLQSLANVLVLQRIMFSLHESLMDTLPQTNDSLIASLVESVLSSDPEVVSYSYQTSRVLDKGAYVRTVFIEISVPGEIEKLSFQMKSR